MMGKRQSNGGEADREGSANERRWAIPRAAVAACVLLLAPAVAAVGDDLIRQELSSLKLRPAVHLRGDSVTMADILIFADADARLLPAIGHKPAFAAGHAAATSTITHEQVVERLRELGVNASRVLVSGALVCKVTIEAACRPSLPARDENAIDGSPLLRTSPDLPNDSGVSLADALRNRIATDLADMGGSADVEFERASQQYLELTSPPWDFAIRAHRGPKIGVREFTVTVRRDGRTHRTARIAVRVRLIKDVLVAAKPLSVGTIVRRGDVKAESRVFERAEDVGIDSADRAVGLQVRKFIAAGQMVRPGDIKAGDLVKRSRPVTMIGAAGNINVRLTAVALDSGGYGDTVRVRIGDSRKDRRELRGIVTGLATVKIPEGEL